ncbi:MAG: restriction endonuclease [Dehalococcoidia bacterium]|nr:restriction endonuclease [Dehalococcoidia bacterium]
MTTQAAFSMRGRNPDVLTCIANLSNDEVFTPPELANRMLDTLAEAWAADHGGADLWADQTVRFLDPYTKSGVFLREITRRLTDGLASQIHDLQERVDHILTKQVFGIATTHLTSLLARRSLYCSKHAAGTHSIAKAFASDAGNIWFEPTEHAWVEGKCQSCGASQKTLDRGEGLETHAYAFIHTDDIKTWIAGLFGGDMQFDVIIGNPPYQFSDGGFGASAAPIYQLFVEQVKRLEPRFFSMVIPARWFTGGKGLDDFRLSMLTDRRLRVIEDYLNSSDAFPGVELQGGICFFLWDRDHPGDCRVTTHYGGQAVSSLTRPLLEESADTFIRHNGALPILKKVMAVENGGRGNMLTLPDDKQFMRLVSPRKPFGLATNVRGKPTPFPNSVKIYQFGGVGYIDKEAVTAGTEVVDEWRVFIGGAHGGQGHGRDVYPTVVLGVLSTEVGDSPGE